jgi:carboxymethylenebutenolidase
MPNYDLVAVWEEHFRSEFVARDVNAPTDTMVPDACVNHVPTMTGGVCRDELKRFYKYHFVKANPPDIEIIPISRTVGTDTIVDEMVAKFTHTCVIDYLLPGIPPTGRSVEIPTVVVAQFRDGKLASEHIYWDHCPWGADIRKHRVIDPASAAGRRKERLCRTRPDRAAAPPPGKTADDGGDQGHQSNNGQPRNRDIGGHHQHTTRA